MIKIEKEDFDKIISLVVDGLFPNNGLEFIVNDFVEDAYPCIKDMIPDESQIDELKKLLKETTTSLCFKKYVKAYISYMIRDEDFMHNLGEAKNLEAVSYKEFCRFEDENYFELYFRPWQDKIDWVDTDYIGCLIADYVQQITRVAFEWDGDVEEILNKYQPRMEYKDNIYIATKEGIVKANDRRIART